MHIKTPKKYTLGKREFYSTESAKIFLEGKVGEMVDPMCHLKQLKSLVACSSELITILPPPEVDLLFKTED